MSEKTLKLPEVPFGPHSISRLVIGGNPPHGGSHQTRLMGTHMREYFTPDQTLEFLRRCSAQGMNVWQSAYSTLVRDSLARFRDEGGEMQFICLSGPREIEDKNKLAAVMESNPIGIAFHGEVTDVMWREGEIDKIPETLAKIRDAGVLAGLSTHNPAVVDYTQEKNWDLDFYMGCVYRESRNKEELEELLGEKPIGEVYLRSDVPRMCESISKARQTCLAFKILAAGRTCDTPEQVSDAFQFVLGHIKPTDAVIVGMYPRYTDQIKENADLVRKFG